MKCKQKLSKMCCVRVNTYQIYLIFFSCVCVAYTFSVEELKWINYEVDISKTPVKREVDKEISHPTVHVTSKSGQEFQCVLPQLNEEEISEKDVEDDKKDTDVLDLLKPMKTGPCLSKGKDWWTYEFCFGHYIKQFHVEDGEIIGQVITLGLYESDYDWNNETNQEKFKHAKQKYHSQYYTNGTKCDLTGQPRNAEVRIYCEEDAGDYIYRVDEPGTCSYIITVHTSRLCSHPLLKPLPSNKAHLISCNPLLDEEQYSIYLQKLKEEKALAEEKRSQWLSNQQERLQVMKNENLLAVDENSKDDSSDNPKKDSDEDKDGDLDKDTLKVTSSDQSRTAILDDEKLQVRIRRLDRKSSDTSGKLHEMDFEQRQKLELAVKEKLEKAGLDTGGRRIEVKIITAGYYDNEEGKDFQSLTDEETDQFQNMIMALLTGQQEAVHEMKRHKKLEDGYQFSWDENEINYVDDKED